MIELAHEIHFWLGYYKHLQVCYLKEKLFVTNSAACDVQYRDPDFFSLVNSFSSDTDCSVVCVVSISEFIDDDLSSSLG